MRHGKHSQHPHDRSMYQHERAVWEDACGEAQRLDRTYDASSVREWFETLETSRVWEFEDKYASLIRDYIGKTPLQRDAFLSKVTKGASDEQKKLFHVLVIIAMARITHLMRLRDQYRNALVPGGRDRPLAAALFEFSRKVDALTHWAWPVDVFAAAGVDDGSPDEDDDEDDDPVHTAPAPAPPRPNDCELLVVLGQCDQYGIAPSGHLIARARQPAAAPLWRLAIIDLDQEALRLAVFDRKPTLGDLKPYLQSALGPASAETPNVLVFPKNVLNAYPALEQAISAQGRVFPANPGVANRVETRWADDYLHALDKELTLLGEPMPHVTEFAALAAQRLFLDIEEANPLADYVLYRNQLQSHVCTLLCIRGREVASFQPGAEPSEWNAAEIKREMAKLERYHNNGTITPFGEVLLRVSRTVHRWSAAPVPLEQVMCDIADPLLAELATPSQPGRTSLSFHLSSYVPSGTPEADLVDACVLARLDGGVPSRYYSSARYPGRPGTIHARWAAFRLADSSSEPVLLHVPRRIRLIEALTRSEQDSTCAIMVADDVVPQRISHNVNSGWTDCYSCWSDAASAFQNGIRLYGGSSPPPKKWMGTNGTAVGRILILAVLAENARRSDITALFDRIGAGVDQHINDALDDEGFPAIHLEAMEPFSTPYALYHHRAAMLMAGRARGNLF